MFWKRKINAKPKPATVKATTILAELLQRGELTDFWSSVDIYYYVLLFIIIREKQRNWLITASFFVFFLALTGACTKYNVQDIPNERSTPTFSYIKDDDWYQAENNDNREQNENNR